MQKSVGVTYADGHGTVNYSHDGSVLKVQRDRISPECPPGLMMFNSCLDTAVSESYMRVETDLLVDY